MVVALLAALSWSGAGYAQDADKNGRALEQIEQQKRAGQDKARELEAQAGKLKRQAAAEAKQIASAARQIRRLEQQLNGTDARLAKLERDIGIAIGNLEQRRTEMALALSALAGVAKVPPIANTFRPDDGNSARLAATALAGLEPALAKAIADLDREIVQLRDLHQQRSRTRETQKTQLASLQTGRQKLQSRLKKHRSQVTSTTREAARQRKRVKSLAAKARNLNDLMRRLNPVKPVAGAQTSTGPSVKALRGRLPLPVAGKVITKFGQPSPGVTISTRDNAMVTVPTDGKVVFSETFRSYGRLLIIDLGDGYHLLVAGMATSGVVVGQWLLAGEPVGWMKKGPKTTKPSLYLELRYNGKPVDPLPWLAANKRKVSG